MKTLLLGEHDKKTLRDSTAKALSCAASLGGEVDWPSLEMMDTSDKLLWEQEGV